MRKLGFGGVAIGMIVAAAGVAIAPAAAHHGPDVTICHATNSNSNPYEVQTVADASVDGGQGNDHWGQHTGPVWDPTLKAAKVSWGDIIPPTAHHAGLNWDAAGQAIHANGCAPLVAAPTGDVTLDKDVTGPNAPAGDPSFSFTVACESGTETSPASIKESDPALPVADDVSQGDSCVVTETVPADAAVTFAVVGGTVTATDAASVTFDVSSAAVAVTATNTYPCPRGTGPNGNGGCSAALVGDVTLDKVLAGPSAPVNDPSFTFTVACDTGTETSPAVIEQSDSALLVADDVAQGDTCVITETVPPGATLSFGVVGGTVVTSDATSVTFDVTSASVAVTATNTYSAGAPFDQCSNLAGNQPAGTSCAPPPPVDECQDLPGLQTDPALCDVGVLPSTPIKPPVTPPAPAPVTPPVPVLTPPTPVTPSTPAAPAGRPVGVAGTAVPRTLPQTGTEALPLLELGLGMVFLGAGAMLFGRERTASI